MFCFQLWTQINIQQPTTTTMMITTHTHKKENRADDNHVVVENEHHHQLKNVGDIMMKMEKCRTTHLYHIYIQKWQHCIQN